MRVLYLSSTSSGMKSQSLYFDLMQEFVSNGHQVYCAYAQEKRDGLPTKKYFQHDIEYLGIRTGNLSKNPNLIDKGIATLMIDFQFHNAINKYFSDIDFDLVLYSTPPITFDKTLKYFKSKQIPIYLMLKDIFPQNAIDLGLFKERGFIHKLFVKKELLNYDMADHIGVMSPANYNYIIDRHPEIEFKLDILPNAISLEKSVSKWKSKEDLGLPLEDILYLYGGNIGKPQSPSFIIKCIDAFESVEGAKFLICGWGSETSLLIDYMTQNNIKNTLYLGQHDVDTYNNITHLCDVGLIFLDHRFTIPNFPQRLLSYLKESKPVIAATDVATDIGSIAETNGFGISVNSETVEDWLNAVTILKNKELRVKMGEAGYVFLSKNYDVKLAYKKIMIQTGFIKDDGGNRNV